MRALERIERESGEPTGATAMDGRTWSLDEAPIASSLASSPQSSMSWECAPPGAPGQRSETEKLSRCSGPTIGTSRGSARNGGVRTPNGGLSMECATTIGRWVERAPTLLRSSVSGRGRLNQGGTSCRQEPRLSTRSEVERG